MISHFRPDRLAAAFAEGARLIIQRRSLIMALTLRDIRDQYAGQIMGLAWAVVHPLVLMAIYVFIFNFVFKARVGGTPDLPLDFTAYMLAGLLPWLTMSQALLRSCTVLVANAGLVKQVVFPVEVLPIKTVFATLVSQGICLVVLLVYVAIIHGPPPVTSLLLPVLLVFQIILSLGLALALSAIGAFLRDVKEVVQVGVSVGIYLTPVFYLPDWVPQSLKPVLFANPFSYVIWCFQDALFFGRFEHPWAWLIFPVGSLFAFIMGYRLFRRVKPLLGNVL